MTFNSRIISISSDHKETIITENGISSVHAALDKNSLQKVLSTPESQYKFEWPAHNFCSDISGLYEKYWSSEDDINHLLDDETHMYIICTSNLHSFFSFIYKTKQKNFTPVLVYGRQLIFGPRIDYQSQACSACFALSLLNNLPSLKARWKSKHQIIFPPQNHQSVEKAVEAMLLIRESCQPWHPPHKSLILDIVSGKFTSEVNLLKLCEACEESSYEVFHDYINNPDELIGEFIGSVKSISQVNSRPKSLFIAAAQSEIIPMRQLGGGVHYNFETAAKKAKYETIERLISSNISSLTIFQKATDFQKNEILSEDQYRPYTVLQSKECSFTLNIYDTGTNYYWLKGRSLKADQPIWVPADFVSLDNRVFLKNKLTPISSNGTAVFDSPHKALQNALLELVERDIVTRCWFKRHLYSLDTNNILPKAVKNLKNEGLDLKLMICGDFNFAPVIIAVLYEHQNFMGAAGSGTGVDIFSASESALFNAATMFAYREQTNSKINLQNVIEESFLEVPNKYVVVNWEKIIEDYEPVVFDLSTELLKKRNIYVTRAWSHKAIAFPSKEHPIPLKLWNPSGIELLNLHKESDLF